MPVVVDDTEDLRHRLVAEVPGLLRYARSLERDPLRADDLVQDMLVCALESASTFRAESSLTTWLHRILHSLAVDDSRRRRDVVVDLSDDQVAYVDLLWLDDTYTVDGATVLARAELRERLRDALLRFPLIYRSAVVLHDAEGLTMTEVAVITDVTLPAAKQRLRRGRMLLVSLLADERDTCSTGVPMRCWDARRRVSDYIHEDISERDRGLLEIHLAGCPTCPPLYAGLVGVPEALAHERSGRRRTSPGRRPHPRGTATVTAHLDHRHDGPTSRCARLRAARVCPPRISRTTASTPQRRRSA